MPVFAPLRVVNVDARLRHIEAALEAATGAPPTSLSSATARLPDPPPTLVLDSLADVSTVDADEGDILVYDSANWNAQNWVHNNLGVGTGASPTKRFEVKDGNTRMFLTDTVNPLSGGKGIHLDKLDNTVDTPLIISFDVEGVVVAEMGLDYDTSSGFADFINYYDATALWNEVQEVTIGTHTAGEFKLTFDGQQTVDIAFGALAATVQTALEGLPNIAPGDVEVSGISPYWLVDFTGAYAGMDVPLMTLANGTTPLSGGSGATVTLVLNGPANDNPGADIMRWTPYVLATGIEATKGTFGMPVGSSDDNTEFLLINAPRDLSGLSVRFRDDDGIINGLNFSNQSRATKRAMMNLNNLWQFGPDYQSTNSTNLFIVDNSFTKTRMFFKSVNQNNPVTGIGTTNPQGLLALGGSAAAAEYNTRQRYLICSTTDDPGSRSINLEGIRDATVGNTVNYAWLMGGLGGSSTAATRTATSSSSSLGLEATDSTLSVAVAGTGSNQTILRPLQFSSAGAVTVNFDVTLADNVDFILNTATGSKIGTSITQKLGFWNANPVVQPAAYTVANPATDRALDVTGDTLAQGLAVLGTLILDLQGMGLVG